MVNGRIRLKVLTVACVMEKITDLQTASTEMIVMVSLSSIITFIVIDLVCGSRKKVFQASQPATLNKTDKFQPKQSPLVSTIYASLFQLRRSLWTW